MTLNERFKLMKKTNFYYSIPIYIGSVTLILFLAVVFIGVSYFLILKNSNIFLIIFIWLLYGLLFRDSIPKLIKISNSIFKNQPALILQNDKLIDNINGRLIPWTDIENIDEFYDTRTGGYIAIKVKNPTDYVDNEKRMFDKIIMRANTKYFNGLFSIRPQMLKCKKIELLDTLKFFWKEHGNN